MGWKGMALGGWLGGLFFGGPLGAILGAALGHGIEKTIAGAKKAPGFAQMPHGATGGLNPAMVFCASAAAMMAKIAKADGRVSAEEIAVVETAFDRLGFQAAARRYAMDVFRRAKNDNHSIYEYAQEFATVMESVQNREIFYEFLWDLAGADGVYSPEELTILRQITASLRIRPDWFLYYRSQRVGGGRGNAGAARSERDEIAEAYRLLGASERDDDATLKRKYRELAKKYHPDLLRAQGLPEEMIGKANEMMGRVNSAWETIKKARGEGER